MEPPGSVQGFQIVTAKSSSQRMPTQVSIDETIRYNQCVPAFLIITQPECPRYNPGESGANDWARWRGARQCSASQNPGLESMQMD